MNPLQKFDCLICGREMDLNHKIKYIDHFCSTQDDHHLSWRLIGSNMAKLRIRFRDGKERLCLKIHYDEKYSEVWTDDESKRIQIGQIIVPNFQDIELLKNKIRTILVFS
jgi:hypothetical protein